MRQTVHLGMRLQPGGQIRRLSPRDQQARVQPRQRCDARLQIMLVDASGFVIFIISRMKFTASQYPPGNIPRAESSALTVQNADLQQHRFLTRKPGSDGLAPRSIPNHATHTTSAPGTEQHENSRLPFKEDQVDTIDITVAATCTEAQ